MMKYRDHDYMDDAEMQLLDEILEQVAVQEDDFSSLKEGALSQLSVTPLDAGHLQMENGQAKRSSRKNKLLIPLIAAVILVMGVFVYASSSGWDSELAGRFGIEDRKSELQDGYMLIGVSDEYNGNVITAVQAIGDDMSQWIQIDTNIPWEEPGNGKEAAYLPYDWDTYVTGKNGKVITGAGELESFDNDGYVSYWMSMTGMKGIDKAKVEVKFGDIRYSIWEADSGEEIYSEPTDSHTYTLTWQNDYDVDIRKFKVNETVDLKCEKGGTVPCRIQKIEITPVTIYVKGTTKLDAVAEVLDLKIDQVKLRDGSFVDFEGGDVTGGCRSGWKKDHITYYITINNEKCEINGNDIIGIVINGKEISLY